jgi:phosphoenolpyruvate synthase/pyruvate phosphate dikinase
VTNSSGGSRGQHNGVLTGIGASPGFASGRARPVHSADEFSSLQPGDVLVCRTTDPAWTPLFSVAAAVVTETGGMLSHAAIVAREHGIPAVLGVAGAMARIVPGSVLAVDGSRGVVTAGPSMDGGSRDTDSRDTAQ